LFLKKFFRQDPFSEKSTSGFASITFSKDFIAAKRLNLSFPTTYFI
jgi:hypothetical protein